MVTAILKSKTGLHMRPAGIFAGEMGKFSCDVWICCGGAKVNGKSIMNLMAAGILAGAELMVCCDGPDELPALRRAVCLIERELCE